MKLPWISRSRYERELRQLENAYASSSSDLKEKLRDLIQHFVAVKMHSRDGKKIIETRYILSEQELSYMSPYQRKELFWHVGKIITEQIQKGAIGLIEQEPK